MTAVLYWVGNVSADSMNVLNWRTSYRGTTTPTTISATDTWIFTDMGVLDCVHNDVSFPNIGGLVWESHYDTVDDTGSGDEKQVSKERRFQHQVYIDSNLGVKSMQLNGTLNSHFTGTEIIFGGTPQLDNGNKYITLEKHAQFRNHTMRIKLGGSGTNFFLDYGNYPFLIFMDGRWLTSHREPTYANNTKITMKAIEIRTGAMVGVVDNFTRKDRQVYIEITGDPTITQTFLCEIDDVNFGWATLAIQGSATGGAFYIPIDGEVAHGTQTGDFHITYGAYRCLKNPDMESSISAIRIGMRMCVNHLIVDEDAVLSGGYSHGSPPAEIECISMPEIKGTMTNFVQVNDGLYRATNKAGNRGGLLNCGILSYRYGGTGLNTLGTSGQVLTTDGANIYWATPSGGGGGGGSGTVTSVDMTVPTGFAISGNPITTAGTLAVSYASGYSLPTDASQANWNTAYGWGNHATAGYLLSETDEKVKSSATDATADYLGSKIIAGSNAYIAIAIIDPATNEQKVEISATDNKVAATIGDSAPSHLTNKLIAGANITLTPSTDPMLGDQITIASTGGGGGGSSTGALFSHDQNPTTHLFSPFRILQGGDTIDLGSVSVFSPAATNTGSPVPITIVSCGNTGNTGIEHIFYGQNGDPFFDQMVYSLDTLAADGVRSMFISHMTELNIGAGPPSVGHQSLVITADSASMNSMGPSTVRVIDAGLHNIVPVILSADGEPFYMSETPEDVRILLVVSYGYRMDRGTLLPNFAFNTRR